MNVFLILMSVYVVSYRKLFTARSVSWSLQQQQVQRRTVCGRTTALFSTVRGCDVILTLVHRWVTVHRSLLYTGFLSLTVNMTWADHQDPHCVPQNSCCPHKVEVKKNSALTPTSMVKLEPTFHRILFRERNKSSKSRKKNRSSGHYCIRLNKKTFAVEQWSQTYGPWTSQWSVSLDSNLHSFNNKVNPLCFLFYFSRSLQPDPTSLSPQQRTPPPQPLQDLPVLQGWEPSSETPRQHVH